MCETDLVSYQKKDGSVPFHSWHWKNIPMGFENHYNYIYLFKTNKGETERVYK